MLVYKAFPDILRCLNPIFLQIHKLSQLRTNLKIKNKKPKQAK
jgi:hypothetical protein